MLVVQHPGGGASPGEGAGELLVGCDGLLGGDEGGNMVVGTPRLGAGACGVEAGACRGGGGSGGVRIGESSGTKEEAGGSPNGGCEVVGGKPDPNDGPVAAGSGDGGVNTGTMGGGETVEGGAECTAWTGGLKGTDEGATA